MNAQHLKNAILQEAIEGRLVPQDPNDEPASALLARIRKEKERLVKQGKLKKKDLEVKPISEDEIPFEIPESWEWVRLGDIGLFERGNGIKRDETYESGFPCVRYGEMYTKYKYAPTFEKTVSFTSKSVFEKCRKAHKGDLFMALTGENKQDISLAAQYVGDEEIAVGGDLCHFTILEAYGLYFVYLINSTYFSTKKEILATGDIIVHISTDKLASIPIPLPPLAEQHRIVTKIEELLSKVEEYGKAQDALNKLNAELPERLKKSVLQEAIEGRLVPQYPNDEPASVLLAKIRKEKEQLVKAGKLKKKDLIETPISEDEIPFEIPDNWEWIRLGDIGVFERGNGIKRDETFDNGYPCVRYGEMYTKYRMAPTFDKTYSYTSLSVYEKCRKAHSGDLFMALTGENKQDIALAAQYVGKDEVAVGGDLCHFTILKAYPLYFVYLINSIYFSSKKEVLATGDIIVHISTDKLGSIPIPLPPLAEQHRIVEKLEQLLGEIDKLKK